MAVQIKKAGWLSAAVLTLMLSGCATVPDAIKGTSPTPQQDLVRVMNAPQLYVGQEARFGGKVVDIKNQQGKTRLVIAAMPLDDMAAPVLGSASRGRIYADLSGFLDPEDFRNQLVTVVGPIVGTEQGKIGQSPYTFMVMRIDGYKRWRIAQQVVMPPQPMYPWIWGPGPWRHHGYWGGPWGGWYNIGPARVQTFVTE
ncbi:MULTISPECIES: Slp family lipoprotein [Tenebrionibacter/Tenebrionicola group]|jgi:outer membrane lipoprotein|uniref:Slp family lipoprotein n=2 Tax=Tenebrionibacter/Tenebrionicola group TaxID=2969848 RepID=A0A8K0UZP9_9ENTR|nr:MULTISPECIES: Slp family lipoprotein [Tenebrionibacter/Tenebrionicola group]MBK4713843.1 Slp family lipoprotein [Tenebrionibacter intestinalis]MBV4411546.1 Slp family lipoprotein [Tenebrionicola larvae]MBV5094724.1 Slp family lipoprotein [Tenebrionicola larvae]